MKRATLLRRRLLALGLGLVATTCGWARPNASQERFELRGEIYTPEGKRLSGWQVLSVYLFGNTTPFTANTLVMGGQFKFRKLLAGSYTIAVSMRGLGETRRTVDVGKSLADSKGRVGVKVILQEQDKRAGRTISVQQLGIPGKAWGEYRRAVKNLSSGDTEAAIAHLEKALELAPHFVQARNHLGTIYYHKRDFSKAEGCFRKALESDGNAYEPLVNLGGTLLNLNRYKEALPFNEHATVARPNDALAQSQLGMNMYGLGDLDGAMIHLNRAKKLDPAHFSHPQFLLAEIYMRKGDRQAAVAELEEFARLHPDTPQAARIRERLQRQRGKSDR